MSIQIYPSYVQLDLDDHYIYVLYIHMQWFAVSISYDGYETSAEIIWENSKTVEFMGTSSWWTFARRTYWQNNKYILSIEILQRLDMIL